MEFTDDVRYAPDDEYVCWCSCVSKGDILRAMRQGSRTLEDIRTATGACIQGQCMERNPRGR